MKSSDWVRFPHTHTWPAGPKEPSSVSGSMGALMGALIKARLNLSTGQYFSKTFSRNLMSGYEGDRSDLDWSATNAFQKITFFMLHSVHCYLMFNIYVSCIFVLLPCSLCIISNSRSLLSLDVSGVMISSLDGWFPPQSATKNTHVCVRRRSLWNLMQNPL